MMGGGGGGLETHQNLVQYTGVYIKLRVYTIPGYIEDDSSHQAWQNIVEGSMWSILDLERKVSPNIVKKDF